MKKLQVVFVAILAISMFGVGYALSFVTTQSIPSQVNVIVRYGNGPIKAYLYSNHTSPVTSINFGNVLQGDSKYVYFYIFNENATYAANVTWSSTLGTVTNKITDSFGGGFQYYDLPAGQSVYVSYGITVATDAPVGLYTWTLYLGVAV